MLEGVQHVDVETVKSYAQDLCTLLEESDFTQSRAFLRSFVKRIVIDGIQAKIQYRLPMPPDRRTQSIGVLSIDTPGGAGVTIGRTFELVFSLNT